MVMFPFVVKGNPSMLFIAEVQRDYSCLVTTMAISSRMNASTTPRFATVSTD